MSKYVPELFNHVGKLYQIEEREHSLNQEKSENQNHIEDAIKKIFENGIIPLAQRRGYGFSVTADTYHEDKRVSWEDFTNGERWLPDALKKRIGNYANKHGSLFISYYLASFGNDYILKQLHGTFHLGGNPPELDLRMHPLIPGQLKIEYLPHGEYRTISADKIEKDLEGVINEYESSIVPKFIQNKSVPQ